MSARGTWVYALTDHAGGEDLSWLAGVGGARVRGATAAGLTVLVSDVDLAEFGEEALRANMEDLDWLEEAARAHHAVIEAATGMFPVLPARFATVYTNDASMAAAFGGQAGELRASLRRVGGCVEWGVKAYAASSVPAGGGTDDAAAPDGPGAGMAYLRRRRAELSAREDSRRTMTASAQAVHAELSGRAAQARLYPPQSPALSGNHAPMLLNASYLLSASPQSGSAGALDFASAVAAVATAHPDLRIDLSGPWPPYSFTARAG